MHLRNLCLQLCVVITQLLVAQAFCTVRESWLEPRSGSGFVREQVDYRKNPAAESNHLDRIAGLNQNTIYSLQPRTKYEQLKCIGFNQNFSLLEATVAIKLPYGFDGELCSSGSTEYVRFWIDY